MSKRNSLKIDHINAQSLLGNKNEIDLLIRERNPDVLCVSETLLSHDIKDEFTAIPDYDVFRCDKGRGGGVCIYVKDVFKVTPVNVDTERPDGVEDVWVAVQCRMLPTVVVGCLYRHPKSLARTFDYISDVLQVLSLRDKPLYVCGDFNDNFLHVNSKVRQILLNTKLTQLIDKPTRITATSATLIDMAITNKPKSVMHSDSIPCYIGDHELITLTINLKKPKRQPCVKTFRQLTNYSPDTFCTLLRGEAHNLDTILATDNVDTQVQVFNEIFNKCLDACAPLVTKEIKRPFAPWITDNLKVLMQERNNVQQDLKIDSNSLFLRDKHKSFKKQVTP